MFKPKAEIFTALSALGHYCAQGGQTEFAETPAITFRIGNNDPTYDLDAEIAKQDVVAVVDIWTDESTTASDILSEVEAAMKAIGYLMSYSTDVPAPEGALNHVTTRFTAIK